jgi:hypothetical protein
MLGLSSMSRISIALRRGLSSFPLRSWAVDHRRCPGELALRAGNHDGGERTDGGTHRVNARPNGRSYRC